MGSAALAASESYSGKAIRISRKGQKSNQPTNQTHTHPHTHPHTHTHTHTPTPTPTHTHTHPHTPTRALSGVGEVNA